MVQPSRIAAAEHRAREILRFSPLITDAYFHYTPSQIMFAALSLADRSLAERLITQTFHYVAPPPNNSGVDTPISSGPEGAIPLPKKLPPRSNRAEDKSQIIGSHLRDRVLGAIEACRDMLARELPERRDHWTNVHIPLPLLSFSSHVFATSEAGTDRSNPCKQKAVVKAQINPLRKKLKQCRDPERWNLVELQRVRREQAARKADSEDGDPDDRAGNGHSNSLAGDAAVFGEALPPKRRKVVEGKKGLDDPFGGPL